MRALKCYGIGESRVEDVPRPEPGDGEVLVEVERVQLSLTECDLYRGIATSYFETFRDRVADGGALAFGHEFAGVVTEVGPGVTFFAVGDRVYPPGKIACHDCQYCRSGHDELCKNVEIVGRHRPGALAEYVAIPTEPLSHLPDEVSFAEGAALQPLASSLLAVHDADLSIGDTVAVVGTGVMGYGCAQFSNACGAGDVIGIDIDPRKLDIAAERGIVPVDASETDPVDRVLELTDGIGADVVFEAVGGDQAHMTEGDGTFAQAFEMVRSGGTIVQIGHHVGDVTVTPARFRSKCVRWLNPLTNVISTGPNADTGDLAARMIADGRVSIEEYITHELTGLDSFEEAVEITVNKEAHGALNPAQIVLD